MTASNPPSAPSADAGRLRLGVLTPIPTPYRDPVWTAVAALDGVDLTVLYCAGGKPDRPWRVDWIRGYRAELLPGWNLARGVGSTATLYWNPKVLDRLRRTALDALIVGGYNHPTLIAAMAWARRHRVPYFLLCESYRNRTPHALKRFVKDRLVGRVVRHARGGFPTGSRARDYLIGYGASPASLEEFPNSPDVESIRGRVARLRADPDSLYRELGVAPDTPVVLFAGRLIPKKRVGLLLRAFARADAEGRALLVVAGDGPRRRRLQELASSLGLASRVRFTGFLQPAELLRWYAAARLFALPSVETWGVVVLEALAAGIPVVVSHGVGCHPDVVTGPEVGEVVAVDDLAGLGEALGRGLERAWDPDAVGRAWEPVFRRVSHAAVARRVVAHLSRRLAGDAAS